MEVAMVTGAAAGIGAAIKLGDAIRYALTRWDGLSRFIDDGRIDLDSNTVERSIRPLALNRKNALYQQAYELTQLNHSRLAMDLIVSGSSMRSFHALQQAVTMVS